MLAIIVSVRVKVECRDEFLAGIGEASGYFRAEPGCLRFDVVQDLADPNHFIFYEVFRGEADLEAHRQSPHLARWAAKRDSGLLEGPMEAIRCRSLFPADAEWA